MLNNRCFFVLGLTVWFGTTFCAEQRARANDLPPGTFRAAEASSLQTLERAVAARTPEVKAARRDVALSEAEVRQSHLLNNPELELATATLPVGATNPAGLARPYANVPSFGVGVAYTFPLGKRAPRQREAAALAVAARAGVDVTTRGLALELARVLGALATSTLRREGLSQLQAGAERSLTLSEARLSTQFGSGLDVDRSRIDAERVAQQRLGTESDIRAQLAACSRLVMRPCEGFASAEEALAHLRIWLTLIEQPQAPLKDRPDLRVLEAQARAAEAASEQAKAQALPDPTIRVGYLHDRFVISGNQRNSLNVGVSLPLTLFDHGQAKRQAADAARDSLRAERAARLQRARSQAALLTEQSALARSRCERLEQDLLPQARQVLTSLEQAETQRLVPLTDVIQARRTVSELLLEEAESCGDAYDATLALLQEAPRSNAP
jgi:cobalt-zinc-cadmium efflux system outer membrane protein